MVSELLLDFQLVCGPIIFKLLICVVTNLSVLPSFVPSVFGDNIPIVEFGMISAETACWDIERK